MGKVHRYFTKELRQYWRKGTLSSKIAAVMVLVTLLVLVVTFCSITMWNLYVGDFSGLLQDSYTARNVYSSFCREQDSLTEEFKSPNSNTQQGYFKAQAATQRSLEAIPADIAGLGRQRYLITQAIQTSYLSYERECRLVIGQDKESSGRVVAYYNAVKISIYIKEYIKQLQDIALDEGANAYHSRESTLHNFPYMVAALSIACMAAAVFLCIVILRESVHSIFALVSAAKKISAGQFDIPDIKSKNQDELGELMQTFNHMKHSMALSIQALHEKNEIENQLHQQEIQRIQTEKLLKSAQMAMLQSQINPHFLFNTLNLISRTARLESAKETENLILHLAKLFRYNLQAADNTFLMDALNTIKDYMYIQQRRFGHRVHFQIDCLGVDTSKVKLPVFTLQPLVENSMIHGIGPKESGGCIRIRIRGKRGCVQITVTDNGVGIAPDILHAFISGEKKYKGHLSGIGLSNVSSRMNLLYGRDCFRIFSRIGFGTAVRIVLPDETEKNYAEIFDCGR